MLTGLCPDWESWDPRKPVDNAREAMQQADDWLGVPQVWVQAAPCSVRLFPSSSFFWHSVDATLGLTVLLSMGLQRVLPLAHAHLPQFTHNNRFSLTWVLVDHSKIFTSLFVTCGKFCSIFAPKILKTILGHQTANVDFNDRVAL